MTRQQVSSGSDTWAVSDATEGVWVSRQLAPGWWLGHRVVVRGRERLIVETRVRPAKADEVPAGGIDSDITRAITVGGVIDAAASQLPVPAALGDLRDLEGLSTAKKRRGEARRWTLAITSLAYVHAIKSGSAHPNEDVARALDVSNKTVTERLYHARRHDPPLLTGGGRRGVVGEVALTDAGYRVIEERFERAWTAMRGVPAKVNVKGYAGSIRALDETTTGLLADAERLVPGIWEMDLAEIAEATPRPRMVEVPAGKGLQVGPDGTRVVGVDSEGRPR